MLSVVISGKFSTILDVYNLKHLCIIKVKMAAKTQQSYSKNYTMSLQLKLLQNSCSN